MDKQTATYILLGRCSFLVLQFLANLLIPDHNAHVFQYLRPANVSKTDELIRSLLGGLNRWDAQYFMHIANYGYTYENSLAFFPLLPSLAKTMSSLFHFVPINMESKLLIIYAIVNVIAFYAAANTLYKLTKDIFNKKFAVKIIYLFGVNPATVFFMAPYTETIFAYLTFNAILHCYKFASSRLNPNHLVKAMLYITLSTLTRSNGLLNIGFLIYFYLFGMFRHNFTQKIVYLKHLIMLFISVLMCLFPYIVLQFYHHYNFCVTKKKLPEDIINYGILHNFVMPGINSTRWCDYKYIPNSYGYVQDNYWNVGFLKYYKSKQLPNFLLALPILIIVGKGSLLFIKENWRYLIQIKLYSKRHLRTNNLLPFVVHVVALSIFCVLFVHIQVTTRMLCSATPIIYWFAVVLNDKWIKYYFWSYSLIGIVMFSNFLPWT